MKIFNLFTAFVLCFLIFSACKESQKTETKTDTNKTLADSLEAQVMDGHDVGMAKYGKLKSLKFQAEQMLDSISKLPAKAKEASAPLKEKLEGLVLELNQAKEGMDKWMQEFDMDSAVDNLQARIKYLTDEKLKVGKVKESILWSLQHADSILKAKF